MNALRLGVIPDTHPYITATVPMRARHVRFADDDTGWQPSPLLDPRGRLARLAQIDVLHVHFGYESLTTAQLQDFVRDVRAAGVGMVVTVHDLRNPHCADRSYHDRHLTILIAAADAILTLTPGAAAEIARRWGRTAIVLAHPTLARSILSAGLVPGRTFSAGRRTVGLHLKSLRANVVDPVALARAAADGARMAGARLRVDIHRAACSPDVLTALVNATSTEDVHVHERFSDDELTGYLAGLDVSVLPYRFGTHSGWLELCRDVGVAVVAPNCGYYAEQWPAAHTYVNNERAGLDSASLSEAVSRALAQPAPAPADRLARLAERDRIRAAHDQVYSHLVRRAAS